MTCKYDNRKTNLTGRLVVPCWPTEIDHLRMSAILSDSSRPLLRKLVVETDNDFPWKSRLLSYGVPPAAVFLWWIIGKDRFWRRAGRRRRLSRVTAASTIQLTDDLHKITLIYRLLLHTRGRAKMRSRCRYTSPITGGRKFGFRFAFAKTIEKERDGEIEREIKIHRVSGSKVSIIINRLFTHFR